MTPALRPLRLALVLAAIPLGGVRSQDPVGPSAPPEANAANVQPPGERVPEVETYLKTGLSIDCADSLAEHLTQRPANADALRRRLVEIIRTGAPREWIIAEVTGLRRRDDLLAPWRIGQCPGDLTVEGPTCPPEAMRVDYARIMDRKFRERALAQYRHLDPEAAARDIDAWRRDDRLDPMVRALLR